MVKNNLMLFLLRSLVEMGVDIIDITGVVRYLLEDALLRRDWLGRSWRSEGQHGFR